MSSLAIDLALLGLSTKPHLPVYLRAYLFAMVTIKLVGDIARHFVHKGLDLRLIGHLPCPENYLEVLDSPLQKLKDIWSSTTFLEQNSQRLKHESVNFS